MIQIKNNRKFLGSKGSALLLALAMLATGLPGLPLATANEPSGADTPDEPPITLADALDAHLDGTSDSDPLQQAIDISDLILQNPLQGQDLPALTDQQTALADQQRNNLALAQILRTIMEAEPQAHGSPLIEGGDVTLADRLARDADTFLGADTAALQVEQQAQLALAGAILEDLKRTPATEGDATDALFDAAEALVASRDSNDVDAQLQIARILGLADIPEPELGAGATTHSLQRAQIGLAKELADLKEQNAAEPDPIKHATDVARTALTSRASLPGHSDLMRDALNHQHDNLNLTIDLLDILDHEPETKGARDAAALALSARQDTIPLGSDASILLQQQAKNLELNEAIVAHQAGSDLASGIEIAKAAGRWQADTLDLQWQQAPSLPTYHGPAQAVHALLDEYDVTPSEEDNATIATLDTLPEPLRTDLQQFVAAFLSLTQATQDAYSEIDLARLAAWGEAIRAAGAEESRLLGGGSPTDLFDVGETLHELETHITAAITDSEVPPGYESHQEAIHEVEAELEGLLSTPGPRPDAQVLQGAVLQDLGVNLTKPLAARERALDANLELARSMTGPAATLLADVDPVRIAPVISLDLRVQDSLYEDDYALLLEAGGNDIYHNNAGGSNLAGGDCGVDAGSSALLLDLAGDDDYTSPRSCGVRGGGYLGVGMLLDADGDDRFTSDVPGVVESVDPWPQSFTDDVPEAPEAVGDQWVVGFQDDSMPPISEGDTHHGANVTDVNPTLGFLAAQPDDVEGFLEDVLQDPATRFVEPNHEVQLLFTPNDPLWEDQYGPAQVKAPEAWGTSLGTPDRSVCIVDTGVHYTHEDLTGPRWLGGHDFANGDGDPMDDNGHGTHVTATAAAGIDNGIGIAGVGHVGILGVKVLGFNGRGSATDIANGIQWCADNDGDVINLSLGTPTDAAVIQDAVRYAWEQGSLLVAASGNSGNFDEVVYPAAYDEVIAVGCTDADQETCWFSTSGQQVELAAPGASILSATNQGNSAYGLSSGTSMSSPHVAGAAALVWSQNPDLENDELRQLLRDGADQVLGSSCNEVHGHGILNISATLGLAIDGHRPTFEPGVCLKGSYGANGGGALGGMGLIVAGGGRGEFVGGSAGTNGGGHMGGLGILVHQGDSSEYRAWSAGTNGGGFIGGIGLLADTQMAATQYTAGGQGTNGGGSTGVGLLHDGGGDDAYRAHWRGVNGGAYGTNPLLRTSPGDFGLDGGIGFLYNDNGDDVYRANCQASNGGVMDLGVALLVDGSGSDQYITGTDGSNGGVISDGIAFLVDGSGNDEYRTWDGPKCPTPTALGGIFRGGGTNGGSSGGLAMLVDGDGDDFFQGFRFGSNGGGSLGSGFLLNRDGDDLFDTGEGGDRGFAGVNGGASIEQGTGFLFSTEGNDSYSGSNQAVNGGGSGKGVGLLVDAQGDDTYFAHRSAVNGGGSRTGLGFLVDGEGHDEVVAAGDPWAGNPPGTRAVNGGALTMFDPGGFGFLYSGDGDDIFEAGDMGANGGAVSWSGSASAHSGGFLFNGGGNNSYQAGERGVNGGAQGLGVSAHGALFDLGGDTTYIAGGLGANGGAHESGAGILFDAGGMDTIQAGSDGTNGGATGDEAYGLLLHAGDQSIIQAGDRGTNGGGDEGGSGAVVDWDGRTTMQAGSQGTNGGGNLQGHGFLFDRGGDDRYFAEDQGVNGGGANGGVGLVVESAGEDRFFAGNKGTNGGGFDAGSGFLLDGDGNDRFEAGDEGVNGGGRVSGGTGILLVADGSNDFKAGSAGANGGGSDLAAGMLLSLGPEDDRFEAENYGVNGGANLNGAGMLLSDGGDDTFTAGTRGVNGAASDTSWGFLLNGGGDDVYTGVQHGVNGGGNNAGRGFLMDLGGGNDTYRGGTSGVNGGAHGTDSIGFILDDDGDDEFDATSRSVNGGSIRRGNGIIVSGGGNDTFHALSGSGANGGGRQAGLGLIVNARGDDRYIGDRHGVNGGGHAGGIGILADLAGNDTYQADLLAVNGGTAPGCMAHPCSDQWVHYGVGLLYDRMGRDVYMDREGGAGVDRSVVSKGEYGAQMDRGPDARLEPHMQDPDALTCGLVSGCETWREGLQDKMDRVQRFTAGSDGSTAYAVGETSGPGGTKIVVLAQDTVTGEILWSALHGNEAGPAHAADIVATPDGERVLVAGSETVAGQSESITFALDAKTGDTQWIKRTNTPQGIRAEANAIALGPSGNNVFTTGSDNLPSGKSQFLTVAHDVDSGGLLWYKTYQGPDFGFSEANALKVSRDGTTLYVGGTSVGPIHQIGNPTGETGNLFTTVAYDTETGAQLWDSQINEGAGNDRITDLTVSPADDRVVLIGEVLDHTGVATLDADNGEVEWAVGVWGVDFSGEHRPADVSMSPDGTHVLMAGSITNAYATKARDGGTCCSTVLDMLAVAFDVQTGLASWVNDFAGPFTEDVPIAAQVSPDGSRYLVTGVSQHDQHSELITVAFDPETGHEIDVTRAPQARFANVGLNSATVTPDGERLLYAGSQSGGDGADTGPFTASMPAAGILNLDKKIAYHELQDALDTASTGDTLRLASGWYESGATVATPGLRLCAGLAEEKSCGATTQGDVVLDATGTGETVLKVDADDVVVQGLTLTWSGDPERRVTGVKGTGDNMVLDGTTIRFRGNLHPETVAIELQDANRARVLENQIEGSSIGLHLGQSDRARVEDNRFFMAKVQESGLASTGMRLVGGGGHEIRGNLVFGTDTGLTVQGTTNVTSRMDQFLLTGIGIRIDRGASLNDQPEGLSIQNANLATTSTALRLEEDTALLNVDAECNDWGAYTASEIEGARIEDEGTANQVDYIPFTAPESTSPTPPYDCLQLPEANFTVSTETAFVQEEVEFTDQSEPGSYPITRRRWDFGDGNNQTQPAPFTDDKVTHAYDEPGVHFATLTITDTQGNKQSMVRPVEVLGHPPQIFGEVHWSGEVGQTISLNYTALAPVGEDPVSLDAQGLPPGANLVKDAQPDRWRLEWTPMVHQTGPHMITLVATNVHGLESSMAVVLEITGDSVPERKIQLSRSSAEVTVSAGQWVNMIARVKNTGEGPVDVAFNVTDSSDWEANTLQDSVTLQPGEQTHVPVTILVGDGVSSRVTLDALVLGAPDSREQVTWNFEAPLRVDVEMQETTAGNAIEGIVAVTNWDGSPVAGKQVQGVRSNGFDATGMLRDAFSGQTNENGAFTFVFSIEDTAAQIPGSHWVDIEVEKETKTYRGFEAYQVQAPVV